MGLTTKQSTIMMVICFSMLGLGLKSVLGGLLNQF